MVETPLPDLSSGEVLLQIDEFALTANNITYAVSGDFLRYWDFFSARDGWGRIPVWGFAEVVASNVVEVPVGTRVYGYLPMSTHLIVTPAGVNDHSFIDGADHRQSLSPIYNSYTLVDNDPSHTRENEPLISLFRPLFTTSFLLDDFEAENDMFGAESIILTSASSKTALGTAFLLSHRQNAPKLVGLTSPGNLPFVKGLGFYDTVLSYDEMESLPVTPAALIDFAGNSTLISRIHHHFGERLKDSCMVGITHWQAFGRRDESLPGPTPTMFFAPKYAQSRIRAWGIDEFNRQRETVWAEFMPHVKHALAVKTHRGQDAVMALYQNVLVNKSNPAEGHVASLWGN